MKEGDYVICKKNSETYTKYKKYRIIKLDYGLEFILHGDKSNIFYYHIESNTNFNVIFKPLEFFDYFYSPKELRKEKLTHFFIK